MFKFASKLNKQLYLRSSYFEKTFSSVPAVKSQCESAYKLTTTESTLSKALYDYTASIQIKYKQPKIQLLFASRPAIMARDGASKNRLQSLSYKSNHTFFTQIFSNQKIDKYIQSLEQEIEENMEVMSGTQLLEKVSELIQLKTELNKTAEYTGYVYDLQKKANALYSIRQTTQALQILNQVESSILSSMARISHSKTKEHSIESRNLKLELSNSILMRIQMQDVSSTGEEAESSLKDCLQAIQYIQEADEAKSDHMVVAQQTLGEAYYKIGNIQESAKATENAAYLLDQLISELEESQAEKQGKKKEKENEISMRQLRLRQAICYESLGNLHFDLRNMAQAEQFFTASLSLWENHLSQNTTGYSHSNTLDELLLKSASQSTENATLSLHPLHLRCLNSIGTFYSTSGQTIKALQVLGNAKKIMNQANVENADNFSWMLLNMAKLYYKQQQYGTSLKLTLESEEVARAFQISAINLAQILEHKSSLLTMQAKHSESAETIEEALSLFKENSTEPIYCRLLFSRGMQCIQTEQFEQAIQYAIKSKQIVETTRGSQDEQVGDALRIIGMAYCSISFKQKNPQNTDLFNQGIQCLQEAIIIFQNNNDTRLQDQEAILGDLANIYEYIKQLKKAIMSYEQQRTVRIHVLESVGLPANTDQIITQIDEKIVSLYAQINQN